MNTHVDFVAILFVVWGALIAVIGLSTLALGVGAASLATSQASGAHVAAGLTAAAFITLAVIAILWGLGHVFIGVPLIVLALAEVTERRKDAWRRVILALLTIGGVGKASALARSP